MSFEMFVDPPPSVRFIITWMQWGFNAICIVACCYMIYRFIQCRNDLHIRIRIPTLTYIYCTSAILMVLSKMMLEAVTCPFAYCRVHSTTDYTQTSFMELLDGISFTFRVTLLGTSFSMKMWYLFYYFCQNKKMTLS